MSTYERAGGAARDFREDYSDEIADAMTRVIARAWAEEEFKRELIADPRAAFADLGLHWPDQYDVEFFDDPSATIGDWATIGRGDNQVVRVPIPPAPDAGRASDDDLARIGGGHHVTACISPPPPSCCCCCLCCCTGAVSHDTWQ